MSVLPIFLYGQSVLRKKAKPVRQKDEEIVRLAGDMVETMKQANGIGLAANQVGDLRRVIVVDLSAIEETADQPPLALINPEVIENSGSWGMEEGCLSIPGLREEVTRAETIRVRYRDLEFKERTIPASGMLARVLLHEIDHLDGVLFVDHLNAVTRKLLRGRLNKIAKGEVEVEYPIVGMSKEKIG
ncbi:MAG: peptide deformylase [Bacteroidota bacterium]